MNLHLGSLADTGAGLYPNTLIASQWGLIDTCRRQKRIVDGEVLYEGSWMKVRSIGTDILNCIVQNGIVGSLECINSCLDPEQENPDQCWSGCGFGYIKRERGICFPDQCSPAELLIARVQ